MKMKAVFVIFFSVMLMAITDYVDTMGFNDFGSLNCQGSYEEMFCPCGENGPKQMFLLKRCVYKVGLSGIKICAPCRLSCNACDNCKTCSHFGCTGCPPRRYGTLCNKVGCFNISKLNLTKISIPKDQIHQEEDYRNLNKDWCPLNSSLQLGGNIQCYAWNDRKFCFVECPTGYKTATTVSICYSYLNKWIPSLEPCMKIEADNKSEVEGALNKDLKTNYSFDQNTSHLKNISLNNKSAIDEEIKSSTEILSTTEDIQNSTNWLITEDRQTTRQMTNPNEDPFAAEFKPERMAFPHLKNSADCYKLNISKMDKVCPINVSEFVHGKLNCISMTDYKFCELSCFDGYKSTATNFTCLHHLKKWTPPINWCTESRSSTYETLKRRLMILMPILIYICVIVLIMSIFWCAYPESVDPVKERMKNMFTLSRNSKLSVKYCRQNDDVQISHI